VKSEARKNIKMVHTVTYIEIMMYTYMSMYRLWYDVNWKQWADLR
jgi:hypothetical protein